MEYVEKEKDLCIYCGKPLSKWESTRSYCWSCSELTTLEAFNEEYAEEQEYPAHN